MGMVRRCYSTQNKDISSNDRQRSNIGVARYVQAELFAQVEVHARSDSGSAYDCPMEKRQQDVVPFGYIKHLANAIARYIDWRAGQLAMRQRQRDKAMATRRRNKKLREQHGQGDNGVVDVSQDKRFGGFQSDDWSSILKDVETQIYDR